MPAIDITLRVTPRLVKDAQGNEKKALVGHLGTHFDTMDKEFPLEYSELPGVAFDVRGVRGRDITAQDIDLDRVPTGSFIAFCTGFIEEEEYGTGRYFKEHPQLSPELVDELVSRGVAIIGVDCAGVRRGAEHTPTDQRCADHGTFVVENLCHLSDLLDAAPLGVFRASTYPANYEGMSGLPCRVVARTIQ